MQSEVFIAFAALLCAVYAITPCRDGWTSHRGSCYLFKMEPLHFTEAQHYCQQMKAHLVHVNDAEENTFIKGKLMDMKTNIWWVGITDEEVEGVWKWVDTDTVAEFTDISPKDHVHVNEDCLTFYAAFGYQWGDIHCTSQAMVICEQTLDTCDCCMDGENVFG